MSQSAGTSGFAPAWGVHHCPSLQASKGGFQLRLTRTSARYDRARRPLDRVSGGVLRGRLQATYYGSAQAGLQQDQHPQGPWTNNACGHNSTLISHVRQP